MQTQYENQGGLLVVPGTNQCKAELDHASEVARRRSISHGIRGKGEHSQIIACQIGSGAGNRPTALCGAGIATGSDDLRRFGYGSQDRTGSNGMGYSKGICNVSTRDGLRSKANRRVGNKNRASLNYTDESERGNDYAPSIQKP